jgi:hypothetical protein
VRRVEPKFVIVFGIGAAVIGWAATSFVPLAWPALSYAIVSAAYAGVGPAPFGKDARGRMHPISTVLLAPYLLFTWLVLLLLRFGSEPGHHEIRPGLFLGRRPLHARELPTGVSLVIDLTTEFPRVPVEGVEYVCLPTLDGSAPHDVEAARALVDKIRAHEGIVYVHCAAGHGRSAAIVASVLIAEGRAGDVPQAVALIRRVRPNIGLSRSQRALVRALL